MGWEGVRVLMGEAKQKAGSRRQGRPDVVPSGQANV